MSNNTNSAPAIGWNIPGNVSSTMTSLNTSFSQPAQQAGSVPGASAPPLPKPRSKLPSSLSLNTSTTLVGGSSNTDPFANLPQPIPVPVQRQSSQGVGSFGNSSPPPSSGSYGYQSKFSGSFGSSSPPPSRESKFNSGSEFRNVSPSPTGQSHTYSFSSGGRGGYQSSETGYSKPASYGKPSGSSYSPTYKPTFSSNSSLKGNSYGMASSVVRDPTDLDILGKFEHVNKTDEKFRMITTYVNNSHGVRDGSVKVHDIYQLNIKGWGAWLKSQLSLGGMGSENMLLWYKTNPRGIQKLAGKMDGCVAFYDRLGRAFPENPNNMKNSSRQIIVLCAVSLGNVHKSPHGFQHWVNIGVPRGCNSVKGVGKKIPDYSANVDDDSFTIPSGPTKKNGEFKNYELDFNEYIVFDASRIKVKYAVDLEVFPASSGSKSSYSGAVSGNHGKFGSTHSAV
ncbi:Poly(ADP-ribose) polymerase pme-1 [Orchesella cincta]|uniref:NAD(+) ADP-ribosyltransferase n=1 Tax=Orchesella cincta TaxID=48709 RepID=A0A1D2MAS3_ORCCI|nr:Poly(ADP-ribose) polymerase pme-1 [Orchesella cincta]